MSPKESKLSVKVASPYQTFFEGSANSLSAINKTGPFDVLYGHSNFFSVLLPGRVTVDTGFEQLQIDIESGILKVTNNTVTLFANV